MFFAFILLTLLKTYLKTKKGLVRKSSNMGTRTATSSEPRHRNRTSWQQTRLGEPSSSWLQRGEELRRRQQPGVHGDVGQNGRQRRRSVHGHRDQVAARWRSSRRPRRLGLEEQRRWLFTRHCQGRQQE